MNDDDQSGETSADCNRRIGAGLRSIRRQRKLTLLEVEVEVEVEVDSGAEFKPSVLGAYERGERAISVPRLARLARLYSVPIEQLPPHEYSTADRVMNGDSALIAVDLVKLAELTIGPFDKLQRFSRMLEIDRHDLNGQGHHRTCGRSSDAGADSRGLDRRGSQYDGPARPAVRGT